MRRRASAQTFTEARAKCGREGPQRKQRMEIKRRELREKGEAECNCTSEGEPELWARLLDGCWPWSLPAPNGTFGTGIFALSPQSYNAFYFYPDSCALMAQFSWPLLSVTVEKQALSSSGGSLTVLSVFSSLVLMHPWREVKVSAYHYKTSD